MQESFCLSMNHLEVGHLGLQLPALFFLFPPVLARAHTHTHTCVCLTAKLTALPRAHPSPGALDRYHTARKIRCRWECSVPRGVPLSRDQDSLATPGGTLPPAGWLFALDCRARTFSPPVDLAPPALARLPFGPLRPRPGPARMASVPLWVKAVA